MTESEAKTILCSVHNPETSADPLVVAALELVQSQPDLQQWYADLRAFDQAIAQGMQSQSVPDGLLDQILRAAEAPEETPVIEFPRRRSRFFRLSLYTAAVAACLLLFVGIGFKDTILNNQLLGYHPGLSEMDQLPSFRNAMAVFVDDTIIDLDYLSDNRNQIQQWLRSSDAPTPQVIPARFDELPTLGCKTFKWRNHEVSLVCFHFENNRILHMFVMDLDGLPPEALESLNGMQRVRNRETGGWIQDNHVIMLVGSHPDVRIEAFLNDQRI